MTLEEMMVKAIRKFRKAYKNEGCEIRKISAYEYSSNEKGVTYALFGVEYADNKGEYHEIEIAIQ